MRQANFRAVAVVALGAFTAAGNWVQGGGHLLPIVAFLLAIVLAEILKRPPVPWSATICLVTEILLLLIMGPFQTGCQTIVLR